MLKHLLSTLLLTSLLAPHASAHRKLVRKAPRSPNPTRQATPAEAPTPAASSTASLRQLPSNPSTGRASLRAQRSRLPIDELDGLVTNPSAQTRSVQVSLARPESRKRSTGPLDWSDQESISSEGSGAGRSRSPERKKKKVRTEASPEGPRSFGGVATELVLENMPMPKTKELFQKDFVLSRIRDHQATVDHLRQNLTPRGGRINESFEQKIQEFDASRLLTQAGTLPSGVSVLDQSEDILVALGGKKDALDTFLGQLMPGRL